MQTRVSSGKQFLSLKKKSWSRWGDPQADEVILRSLQDAASLKQETKKPRVNNPILCSLKYFSTKGLCFLLSDCKEKADTESLTQVYGMRK